MTIRRAAPSDAANLARLIELIWQDDKPSADHIARSIPDTNRATLVYEHDEIIGFVDSFATIAVDGALRWEVDLLGVRADQRGSGVGRSLISAALDAGRDFGASQARAIVRSRNWAAIRAFTAEGFEIASGKRILCVSAGNLTTSGELPSAHLVSVNTLTYRGVWIEPAVTTDALLYAQNVVARYGWNTAGVLAKADEYPLAQAVGYTPVDNYFVYLVQLT